MSKSSCPHCGAPLYGLVSSCYKCGGSVDTLKKAERAMEASRQKHVASRQKAKTTMKKLQALQAILLANWLIVPVLAITIWATHGSMRAIVFAVGWLVLDKLWDLASGRMILTAGKVGDDTDPIRMELEGEVPRGMASMMILDLIVTLLLPIALGIILIIV